MLKGLIFSSESYPSEEPKLFLRGENISQQQKDELLLILYDILKTHPNEHVLKILINLADKWISEHVVMPLTIEKNAQTKKQKQRETKKKVMEDVAEPVKKSRMKTADEVIYHILWDEKLKKEYFSVGYLDRFRGIVEKEFSAFSWEDISSVGIDVLVVPRHRIVYFKYKTLIIWHKAERLDLIFGSTGSTQKNIHEIIAEYEEHVSGKSLAEEATTVLVNPENTVDEEELEMRRKKPTHFLAVRITNEKILNKLADIQDTILKTEPGYLPCLAPPSTAHITLFVMGLDTAEHIADACRMLRESKEMLKKLNADDLTMYMKGLGNFNHRVLFVNIGLSEIFKNMVEDLKKIFKAGGISLRGDRGKFKPHLTIFKGADYVQDDITRSIIPEILNDKKYKNVEFGSQKIEEISLCAMAKEKTDDGYYQCLASVSSSD